MDEQLRKLARQTYCPYLHSKYIKYGLRAGLLELNRVALCAFLRHKPSEYAMCEYDKGDNFIWFDRVLNRHEPLPLIMELRRWGSRITIMAACGVIDYLLTQRTMSKGYFEQPMGLFDTIVTYSQADNPYEATSLYHLIRNWPIALNVTGPMFREEICLYNVRQDIISERDRNRLVLRRRQTFSGLNVLVRQNVHIDDEILLKSMRKYVIPWALGRFNEDTNAKPNS